MSEERDTFIDLIEKRIILRKSTSLPLRFRYHPETGSTSMWEVMEGREDGIKEFATGSGLVMRKFPWMWPSQMYLAADAHNLRGRQSLISFMWLGRRARFSSSDLG